ncbi:MAG TPA: acyltransferase family protein [Acidimicrobiales bacterium]
MTADRPTDRYQPALDGLRACAVAAVIAYHLGMRWMRGGYLGVDLFFVLSGYLITGLLVDEWEKGGAIRLRAFWARRARRLFPALLVVLVAIGAWVAFGGPGIDRYPLRADGLATLFYSANWHAIAAHRSYFARFAAPSPLEHTWSLAIEEQFYALWPLVVIGLLAVSRRIRRFPLVATSALALASAAAMALLFHPGQDPSRVYFGTDTRAFELLVGAGLAFALASRPRLSPSGQRALHATAIVAATAIGGLWATAGGPPAWMFRGGMVGAAGLVAVMVWSVTEADRGWLGRLLSLRPLRWLGRVSYGLYLWHWPVVVIVSPATTTLRGPALDAARIGLTLALATISFYLVELPIRIGKLAGWPARVLAPTATGATAAVLLMATLPTAAAVATVTAAPPASTAVAPAASPLPPGTDPGPSPIKLPAGRVISPSDPLRVMLIGDSVMYDDEPAITAALQATGMAQTTELAFPGWGLTRGSGWRTDWPSNLARFRPDIVMGTWSWDDSAARADLAGYAELLDEGITVLTSGPHAAAGVVLLEFPRGGPRLGQTAAQAASEESGRGAWNLVASQRAAAHPGQVSFLPVAASLDIDGRFSTWLQNGDGSWARARKIDALHLCPTGAARLATAVAGQLAVAVGFPAPAPSWWSGRWSRDPRYDNPPGSCPDDQPPAGFAQQLTSA